MASFHDLPLELIGLILRRLFDILREPQPRRKNIMRISLVNSTIRHITLNEPYLWTDILLRETYPSMDVADLCLQRAKNDLIRVTVFITTGRLYQKIVQDFVKPNAARIAVLRMRSPMTSTQAGTHFQTLLNDINLIHLREYALFNADLAHPPRAETLQILKIPSYLAATHTFKHLLHLQMGTKGDFLSAAGFLGAIASVPCLQTLWIAARDLSSFPSVTSAPPILLANLTSISIVGVPETAYFSLLQRLQTPALERMRVLGVHCLCSGWRDETIKWDTDIVPPYTTVKYLHCQVDMANGEKLHGLYRWVWFAMLMPNLTHLRLPFDCVDKLRRYPSAWAQLERVELVDSEHGYDEEGRASVLLDLLGFLDDRDDSASDVSSIRHVDIYSRYPAEAVVEFMMHDIRKRYMSIIVIHPIHELDSGELYV